MAAIGCLFVVGNQAFAHENAIDVVPAATLLLPYFEVDLLNPNGRTTLFSVNNASAAPQLAHITLWTDMSRPTLDFTIYLTGYDVQTFNLGELFRTGGLPPLIGPKPDPPGIPGIDDNAGLFSEDSGDAVNAGEGAACTFPLPLNIGGALQAFINQAHTGRAVAAPFGDGTTCYGTIGGGSATGNTRVGTQDDVARGYLTVDVVSNCSQFVITQTDYFNQVLKTRSDANVIWGDFFLVDPGNNFAQGETLVHLETYDRPVEPGPGGVYTFYGRYTPVTPYNGADNREPLATTWGTRYLVGGLFTGGTDLLCWRDNGNRRSAIPFSCATSNSNDGQPLSQNQVVIFDEDENPVTITGSPFSPPQQQQGLLVCPWESTRTRVGGPRVPVPSPFGWLYLNLNTNVGPAAADDFPTNILGRIHQAWVGAVMSASGRFSVGFEGVAFDHASDPTNLCLRADTFGPPFDEDGIPNAINCP